MKLYQITENHQQAFNQMADAGFTQEEINDNLAAIQGEFEDKAISCIMHEKTLQGQIDSLSNEIKRLSAMKKSIDAQIINFREYIRFNMEATGIEKIEHPLFKITLCKAMKIVSVDDLGKVPEQFLIQGLPRPDKGEIKKALADGDVNGCSLIDGKRGLLIK